MTGPYAYVRNPLYLGSDHHRHWICGCRTRRVDRGRDPAAVCRRFMCQSSVPRKHSCEVSLRSMTSMRAACPACFPGRCCSVKLQKGSRANYTSVIASTIPCWAPQPCWRPWSLRSSGFLGESEFHYTLFSCTCTSVDVAGSAGFSGAALKPQAAHASPPPQAESQDRRRGPHRAAAARFRLPAWSNSSLRGRMSFLDRRYRHPEDRTLRLAGTCVRHRRLQWRCRAALPRAGPLQFLFRCQDASAPTS